MAEVKKKIIKGRSMHPFFKEGDLIAYRPVELAGIKTGDVLLYRSSSQEGLVCHRVVKKRKAKIYVKGDNELFRPLPVKISSIVGTVILLRRNGRSISLNTIPRRLFSRTIALLSLMSLTPGNLRERFILQIYDRFLANFLKSEFFRIIIPVKYRYFQFCEPGNPERSFKIRAFDKKDRPAGSIDLHIKSTGSSKTGFIGPGAIGKRARERDLSGKLLKKAKELASDKSLIAIFACEHDK